MAEFEPAVAHVLNEEKGLLEDKETGEVSNWGISLAFLSRLPRRDLAGLGLKADAESVRALTADKAKTIYRRYFWDPLRLGLIQEQDVATKVFDLAVNMGAGPATRIFQQAMKDLGTTIVVDGVLGPKTIWFSNRLEPKPVLAGIRRLAEARYRQIAANKPALRKYLSGWLARLAR